MEGWSVVGEWYLKEFVDYRSARIRPVVQITPQYKTPDRAESW